MQAIREFLPHLIDIVTLVFVPVIIKVLNVFAHAAAVKIQKDMEQRLLGIVKSSIRATEEWAKFEPEPSSSQKLAKTVELVKKEAGRSGLQKELDKRADSLESLIHGQLEKVKKWNGLK